MKSKKDIKLVFLSYTIKKNSYHQATPEVKTYLLRHLTVSTVFDDSIRTFVIFDCEEIYYKRILQNLRRLIGA